MTCITLSEPDSTARSIVTKGISISSTIAPIHFGRPGLEFRCILVPTDFSSGATRALQCARSIAGKFQSKIFLLHIIPVDLFELDSPQTSLEALTLAREFAKQQLDRLASEGESTGIAHETIIVEGPAWTAISEVIKANQIDLVAIGTQGKSNRKKLVLGSVVEKIYRMADCPVLTVPPQLETTSDHDLGFRHLLFATNFKPHNERAAVAAHLFDSRQNVRLTVLHVVEDSSESSSPSQKLVEEFMIKRMRKMLPEACQEQCNPDFLVRFGKPAEEILAAAEQLKSNLILLGVRTAPRTAGHLPSPVAYSIVCQSTCPVLTLHQ